MSIDQTIARDSVVELPEDECRELLTTTTVGRIAFAGPSGQELVPVNYAVIDDVIYFRVQADRFLSQLARGHADVAFGVDFHDDTFRTGWNVTVKGAASQVEDRATINRVLSHRRLHPWAGGVRAMVIRVRIESVQGRRVFGG